MGVSPQRPLSELRAALSHSVRYVMWLKACMEALSRPEKCEKPPFFPLFVSVHAVVSSVTVIVQKILFNMFWISFALEKVYPELKLTRLLKQTKLYF